jgi:hypothetical protein
MLEESIDDSSEIEDEYTTTPWSKDEDIAPDLCLIPWSSSGKSGETSWGRD